MSRKMKLSCAAVGLCWFVGVSIGDEPASKAAPDVSSDRPAFAATTTEPVLLRYKAEVGRKVNWRLGLDTDMGTHVARGRGDSTKMKLGVSMRMEGGYEVQSVENNGDFTVRRVVGRMVTKVSGRRRLRSTPTSPATAAALWARP